MCTRSKLSTSKLARNQNTSIISKPMHAHWGADIKQVDKRAQHGGVVKFWGKDRFWAIGQLERTIVSLPSASWIWASRLLPPVPPGMTTSPCLALLLSSSISKGWSISTASQKDQKFCHFCKGNNYNPNLFLQKNSKTTQERHKAYSFAVRAGKLLCEYGDAESDSGSETKAKEKTHTHTQDTQPHTKS